MAYRSRITKISLVILVILFSLSFTAAESVSAVPGSIDFGEIERGETLEKTFYVQTNDINQNFTVAPRTYSDSYSQMFSVDSPSRFDISEQSFDNWVTVEEARINPETKDIINLESGSSATVSGSFDLMLEVPENRDQAEPGVRNGVIELNPDLSADGDGAGARLIGTTKVKYGFEIPGNVQRQITAQDVRAFRQGESQANVEVLLRNSGSVTTSTEEFNLEILNSNGNSTANIQTKGVSIEPRESRWVGGYWTENEQIEEGVYQVQGDVNYMTGSATASGSFSLPGIDRIEVRPEEGSDNETEQEGGSVPIWFVVIVLVILGVLMWGFEIEPFWIVAILGVVGISAFILLSGLPNFLLAVLLIMVGIVIYGGM